MAATTPATDERSTSHNDIYIAFVPWILFSVISRHDTLEAATLVALVASILIAIPGIRRGRPKILEVGAVVAFAGFTIVAFIVDPAANDWLERYGRAVAAALLALIAFASLALNMPFTEQYARETVPEQYWQTQRFKSVNRQITLLWALVFTLFIPSHIVAGYLNTRHSNTIFNWIIPIALVVFAVKRTGELSDSASS
jgi:MFS family permease